MLKDRLNLPEFATLSELKDSFDSRYADIKVEISSKNNFTKGSFVLAQFPMDKKMYVMGLESLIHMYGDVKLSSIDITVTPLKSYEKQFEDEDGNFIKGKISLAIRAPLDTSEMSPYLHIKISN